MYVSIFPESDYRKIALLYDLYLENILSMGAMIAGLLVNSGIGILILFKVNKNQKEKEEKSEQLPRNDL